MNDSEQGGGAEEHLVELGELLDVPEAPQITAADVETARRTALEDLDGNHRGASALERQMPSRKGRVEEVMTVRVGAWKASFGRLLEPDHEPPLTPEAVAAVRAVLAELDARLPGWLKRL